MIDFNEKISKKEFLLKFARTLISLSIFSLLPIRSFAKKQSNTFKMKIKDFKSEYLYKKNNLAG